MAHMSHISKSLCRNKIPTVSRASNFPLPNFESRKLHTAFGLIFSKIQIYLFMSFPLKTLCGLAEKSTSENFSVGVGNAMAP